MLQIGTSLIGLYLIPPPPLKTHRKCDRCQTYFSYIRYVKMVAMYMTTSYKTEIFTKKI
jgi:hypothetical protein